MSETTTTVYQFRARGYRAPRHEISGPDGPLGALTLHRNRLGVVAGARYQPEKGEVLLFRRDPGILRSQFSIWTEGNEWLGSSLRRHFLRRDIEIWTGTKPFRLLPLRELRRGWRLLAPKTGEVARIHAPLLGRSTRVEAYRRMEFELVLFTYFLGTLILTESLWPGPAIDATPESLVAAGKA